MDVRREVLDATIKHPMMHIGESSALVMFLLKGQSSPSGELRGILKKAKTNCDLSIADYKHEKAILYSH